MMPIRAPRVFTIPPGAPFLPTLSRALLDGEVTEGFPGSGGPLALAEATIYLPTQRAAQALARALVEASAAFRRLMAAGILTRPFPDRSGCASAFPATRRTPAVSPKRSAAERAATGPVKASGQRACGS